MRLVLASQSPRRAEILKQAGFLFSVRAANIDESTLPEEEPLAYAKRIARQKAEALPVARDEVVVAGDTIVVLDSDILGKPAGVAEAKSMLQRLSGREHDVISGICLRSTTRMIVDAEITRVWCARLSQEEIEQYVNSGEPMDKAGAYAIQGLFAKFVERIDGSYANVVGLPIALVYRSLRSLGALTSGVIAS